MTLEDANQLLYNSKVNNTFDIIDLDPYGSVVPFL
jgi:tRNA G26 N,N-dimethylase Trm1